MNQTSTSTHRLLLLAAVTLFGASCESKMEEGACRKLRGQAFEALNKGQPCTSDSDCRQSAWPGCEKPVNHKTFDLIKPMEEQFKTGKCEETKQDCRQAPEVYCKQGLCVHREKGIVPTDDIRIE